MSRPLARSGLRVGPQRDPVHAVPAITPGQVRRASVIGARDHTGGAHAPIRPIELFPELVNHNAPSGPTMMLNGREMPGLV